MAKFEFLQPQGGIMAKRLPFFDPRSSNHSTAHVSLREFQSDSPHQLPNMSSLPGYDQAVKIDFGSGENHPFMIVFRLAFLGAWQNDEGGVEVRWRAELHSVSRKAAIELLSRDHDLMDNLKRDLEKIGKGSVLLPIFNGAYILVLVGMNNAGMFFSSSLGCSGFDLPANQKAIKDENRRIVWSHPWDSLKSLFNGDWQPLPGFFINRGIDPWEGELENKELSRITAILSTATDNLLRGVYETNNDLRHRVQRVVPNAPHAEATRFQETTAEVASGLSNIADRNILRLSFCDESVAVEEASD